MSDALSYSSRAFPGLKGGGGGGGGASDGQGSTFTYTFHGDPHATFATFFGGTNPFEMFFGRKVTANKRSGVHAIARHNPSDSFGRWCSSDFR